MTSGGQRHQSIGRGLVRAWIAGGDSSRPLPPGVRPWVDGAKVARPCPVEKCHTLLFDWSDEEVDARVAGHLEREHPGQSL